MYEAIPAPKRKSPPAGRWSAASPRHPAARRRRGAQLVGTAWRRRGRGRRRRRARAAARPGTSRLHQRAGRRRPVRRARRARCRRRPAPRGAGARRPSRPRRWLAALTPLTPGKSRRRRRRLRRPAEPAARSAQLVVLQAGQRLGEAVGEREEVPQVSFTAIWVAWAPSPPPSPSAYAVPSIGDIDRGRVVHHPRHVVGHGEARMP